MKIGVENTNNTTPSTLDFMVRTTTNGVFDSTYITAERWNDISPSITNEYEKQTFLFTGSDIEDRDGEYFRLRMLEGSEATRFKIFLDDIEFGESLFPSWIASFGLTGADAELSADPDSDGMDNETEYIQGTHPNNATDNDQDGLSDDDEINFYFTDPLDPDSDDDGFDDGAELTLGLNPTNDNSAIISYIQNNEATFDLYSSNVVMDVEVGQILLEVSNSTVSLSLQLEKSDNLITWTNAGDSVEWDIPASAGAEFYRVRSSKD